MTCDQCGKPCRALFPVTRHRSLLPASKVHALKSWYPVQVGECCIGPAMLERENVALPYMQRREVGR